LNTQDFFIIKKSFKILTEYTPLRFPIYDSIDVYESFFYQQILKEKYENRPEVLKMDRVKKITRWTTRVSRFLQIGREGSIDGEANFNFILILHRQQGWSIHYCNVPVHLNPVVLQRLALPFQSQQRTGMRHVKFKHQSRTVLK